MNWSGACAARLACSWRTILGAVIWEGNLGFAVRAAQEFGFVDLLDPEGLRLLELGPRIGADDQRGRLLRQAVGHVAAGGLDQVAGLLPRERGSVPVTTNVWSASGRGPVAVAVSLNVSPN